MKLLIVGGVAGGASAAARARRLNEDAEIILFEKGEYVSFANCGLPYHVGNVIIKRNSLLIMTPERLKTRTNIDVRIKHEVLLIDTRKKLVTVKDLQSSKTYQESYDKMVLSTGSSPWRPPIPGANDPDVLVLWTMADMDQIIARIKTGIKKAVVIGAGFIGLEIVENLINLGIKCTVIEALPQVLPPLDPEMACLISESLKNHGVNLYLNEFAAKIEKDPNTGALKIYLKSRKIVESEMVIMAVGVKPNSELAKKSGLAINEKGSIIVNKNLQTSDHDIYAVGDVIQINDLLLDNPAFIPLAGPANKQGRIAADNIFGNNIEYKGSLGTAICKVFERTAASVGINEKRLKQTGLKYQKLYILPSSHASYYPGASTLYIKVLFNNDGYILGAQVVGCEGVDKRIDILATAIRNKLTLTDLEELELSYSPQFGSAKDPINYVGFVGNNILHGDMIQIYPDSIPENSYLLDVREPQEFAAGTIPKAKNIPLGKLRDKLAELPSNQEIITFCKVGLRGYLAERILRQKGFNVKNLSGGYEVWKKFNDLKFTEEE